MDRPASGTWHQPCRCGQSGRATREPNARGGRSWSPRLGHQDVARPSLVSCAEAIGDHAEARRKEGLAERHLDRPSARAENSRSSCASSAAVIKARIVLGTPIGGHHGRIADAQVTRAEFVPGGSIGTVLEAHPTGANSPSPTSGQGVGGDVGGNATRPGGTNNEQTGTQSHDAKKGGSGQSGAR